MRLILTQNSVLLYDGSTLIEKTAASSCIGNIYKGRVLRRLAQMSALSVDIGSGVPAFLPVEDINDHKQGDEIAVQAVTDARGKRGSRLTEELSVPGFYTVLLFGGTRGTVGVSKNIKDDGRRLHLKSLARKILPRGTGAIIRTEAEHADDKEIVSELEALLAECESIQRDTAFYTAPRSIRAAATPQSALRRLWNADVKELVFESAELMHKIAAGLPESIKSGMTMRVDENAADENADGDFVSAMQPGERETVRLPCGGNIVVERTEALTVVDVNSGECRLRDKEQTALTVNLEAAHALMLTLRRRRVSGMILIDFIDMGSDEHKSRMIAALEEECRADTARCKLFGFTNMELFEMTRKPRH